MRDARRDEARPPMLLVVAATYEEARNFLCGTLGLRLAILESERLRVITSEQALRGWRTGTLVITTEGLSLRKRRLFDAVEAFIASRHLKPVTIEELHQLNREAVW